MNRLAAPDSKDPVIFHSEWGLRAHWGRAFEILRLDSHAGRRWLLLRRRDVRVAREDLERPERDEPREALALRANVAVLWRQHADLAARMDARLRDELDAQREDFHRELMRKSFEIAELELGRGGRGSAAAATAAAYEASLSWRITRPLRAAGNLLRRI